MKLHAALSASLRYIRRATAPRSALPGQRFSKWLKALAIQNFSLRSLWGLWFFHLNHSPQRVAPRAAHRFCTSAARSADPFDRLLSEQILGGSEHHQGSLSAARGHFERVLVSDRKHIFAPDG